jgi:hypothetical protein
LTLKIAFGEIRSKDARSIHDLARRRGGRISNVCCGATYQRPSDDPPERRQGSAITVERDMSPREREVLEQALSNDQERRQKAVSARTQKAASLAAAARGRLRDTVGLDHWTALRDLMKRENVEFRDLRQPPHGLTTSFAAANGARMAKVDEFLRERQVGP